MFRKENQVPSKQGVFYQLNLNKNNGPYLSKDIMYNNPKSNNLLSHQSILHQHKMMVQTLTDIEKNIKIQHNHDEKTQNFNAVIQYCESELAKCQEVSGTLEREQSKFKEDIQSLYSRISSKNNELLESSIPVLKNLMKKVKESNQSDKAEYYKIQKQLHSVQMQKRSMEHMIISCRNRIESLQKIFGCKEEQITVKSCFTTTTNFYE